MSKVNLIPELRFPEFKNDGEWEEKILIDTADKKVKWSFTGGPFGSNLIASDYKTHGIRIIQLQNIGDGVFNDENKIYASIEKADELLSCNIYAGDIIISKMGDPVGRACIIPDFMHRCIMASDGIRLVVDKTKYSKYFIFSLINSKQIRHEIEKKSTGSTRKRIGLDTLREVELILPKSIKEQQKIASCLSSLDELIAAHSQKLDALKNHKKGLMQNLFPQEGETVPKYRFKEFENDGEWVEKTLGSICEIITKGTTPQNFSKKGIRFIKIEAFQENHIIPERCMFIDEDTHKKELKRSILKENDILFAIAGATIGKVNLVKKEILPANTNQALAILRLKEKENKNFILQILKSQIMQVFIQKSISIGAQPNLNLEQMGSFSFAYPENPLEQQKIASCLSSLDALIMAQADKIEQLKLHKKGLMQGLFPKIND